MRRKLVHKAFMNEAFIPIPTLQFYEEVQKRRKNNNALISKEYDVIKKKLSMILHNNIKI